MQDFLPAFPSQTHIVDTYKNASLLFVVISIERTHGMTKHACLQNHGPCFALDVLSSALRFPVSLKASQTLRSPHTSEQRSNVAARPCNSTSRRRICSSVRNGYTPGTHARLTYAHIGLHRGNIDSLSAE